MRSWNRTIDAVFDLDRDNPWLGQTVEKVSVMDADVSRHVGASRERLLHAANWLREAAAGPWIKDIEPEHK
jgi:hypothetical protein